MPRKKRKEHPRDAETPQAPPADAKEQPRILLPDDISKIESERDEYLEMARRARADYNNLQRRTETQLAAARSDARAEMALDMLTILDDLERALDHAGEGQDYNGLVDGIGLVRDKFLAVLARYRIAPIDATGAPFDHNYHHAMAEMETEDAEPGTVIAVTQKGYTLADRLLRPSQVIVARAPKAPRDIEPSPENDSPRQEP